MKSFIEHINVDKEVLDKKPKKAVDEAATMGDLLIGLGAAGGLMALKKGWDMFGKGSKLHKSLAITQKQKAGAIEAEKEKKADKIKTADSILSDPKSSKKAKEKAKKTLKKNLSSTEKAQRKLDDVKKKEDDSTTRADAKALKYDKDEDGIIIKPGDAEKYKKTAKKAPPGWETRDDGKLYRKDDKPDKKEPDTEPEGESFTPVLEELVLEETMTLQESEELQAIMALDDAKIKADINKKGQVVVKKKDLKKAEKILKKEFGGKFKTLMPKLVGEEVLEDGTDAMVNQYKDVTPGQIVKEKTDIYGFKNYPKRNKVGAEIEKLASKGGAEADKLFVIATALQKGRIPNKFIKELSPKRKKEVHAIMKDFGWKILPEEIIRPRTAWDVVSKARAKIIEAVDAEAARELYLFMQNERSLIRQKDSIIKNIARKMKSGKYDHKKAPKLWMFWVDNGAKEYDKLYSSPGVKTFDKDTKMSVAIQLADEYKAEIELGNYN